MMAEGNTCGGQSKSRSVLGDVTNRIGKRGFSGREKNGIKSFDSSDKDAVKRVCVSPRPCSEINSLKGNVISGLSKIPNENRDPNVSGTGSSYAVSKSSTDVYDDNYGGPCLKGKNVIISNSKFHGGHNQIKILDFRGGNVVSQSVNEMDIAGNSLVDSRGQTENSNEVLPRRDKVANQNHLDPNLANREDGKDSNPIANGADGCGQLELDLLKKNKISGTPEVVNENKCPSLEHFDRKNLVDLTISSGGEIVLGSTQMENKENDPNLLVFKRSDNVQARNSEAHYEFSNSFAADTSRTVSETGNVCLHDVKNCDAGQVNVSLGGTQTDINCHSNDLDDHNADNFVLSQSGSIDWTILPESQESGAFETDRSTKLKEDECAHMNVGTNPISSCSCSFCTKAAYIWLDLHQKDIRARISALKKSQKDASILAERSCRIKVSEKHGAESVSGVSKLESHLMHQWRSLFQRMADIWEVEGNQLEASLLPLNNLREKCKADLELINAKQSEKH